MTCISGIGYNRRALAANPGFDVLVLGSGASGLAAAVSASRAGAHVALATKGSIQSCNSAKAQGGIQAAVGPDDSPEQPAEDVWKPSHETADRRLVEILTTEAPSAIQWLEELGVEFTRENGGSRLPPPRGAPRASPLRRGVAQASAAGRRPHRSRDHDGVARRRRELRHPHLSEVTARRARPDRERLAPAARGTHKPPQ